MTQKIIYKDIIQKYQQYIVFVAMFGVLLLKDCLFNMFIFDDNFIHSCLDPIRHYPMQIVFSIFAASFAFMFKKQWWSVILNIIIDAWICALLIYYQAWGELMNVSVIMMAGNMDGFWNSIWLYVNWRLLLFPILTILYSLVVVLLPTVVDRKRWYITLILLIATYLSVPVTQYDAWKEDLNNKKAQNMAENRLVYEWNNIKSLIIPFQDVNWFAVNSFVDARFWEWEKQYVRYHHVADYGIAIVVYQAIYHHCERDAEIEPHPLTQEDREWIDSFITEPQMDWHPQRDLIYILVESFESWVVDYQTEDGYVMPNLHRFMTENSIFYADKIKSQVKYGGSGDGQMTLMTGLLPISKGSAALSFGDNVFPSFAHLYPASRTINPCHNTWNQNVTNISYGIKELCEGPDFYKSDSIIFRELIKEFNSTDSLSFSLAITISSHVPFEKGAEVNFKVDEKLPQVIQDYLRCMHYFDGAFNLLLTEMETNNRFRDADIVITGDHTIFQKFIWNDLCDYWDKHNYPHDDSNYVPLIISSPTITSTMRYDNLAYQMDEYPTILHIIDIRRRGGYWWNGIGLDLMDTTVERRISEEDAYRISDLIILNNYFDKLNVDEKTTRNIATPQNL